MEYLAALIVMNFDLISCIADPPSRLHSRSTIPPRSLLTAPGSLPVHEEEEGSLSHSTSSSTSAASSSRPSPPGSPLPPTVHQRRHQQLQRSVSVRESSSVDDSSLRQQQQRQRHVEKHQLQQPYFGASASDWLQVLGERVLANRAQQPPTQQPSMTLLSENSPLLRDQQALLGTALSSSTHARSG